MSTVSVRPAALTFTFALEPIPRSGPAYSHCLRMWLVNGSWLAITSRKSKTSSRGLGTSMDVSTGFMYHMVHCPQVEIKRPRDRLLDAAIDHVAQNGLGDLSLRGLAAALGTSHRMLIHHFGSKERLWVEIVRT